MFCNYQRASSIMVIMAQPLAINAGPVRICYFATNNKFTASDVENRIAYVTSELKKKRDLGRYLFGGWRSKGIENDASYS